MQVVGRQGPSLSPAPEQTASPLLRCMSTLFKDPAWSQKSLQGPIERAQTGVCSSKTGAFSVEQLQYYVSEFLNHGLCLIDIWGLFIKRFLHQEVRKTE